MSLRDCLVSGVSRAVDEHAERASEAEDELSTAAGGAHTARYEQHRHDGQHWRFTVLEVWKPRPELRTRRGTDVDLGVRDGAAGDGGLSAQCGAAGGAVAAVAVGGGDADWLHAGRYDQMVREGDKQATPATM